MCDMPYCIDCNDLFLSLLILSSLICMQALTSVIDERRLGKKRLFYAPGCSCHLEMPLALIAEEDGNPTATDNNAGTSTGFLENLPLYIKHVHQGITSSQDAESVNSYVIYTPSHQSTQIQPILGWNHREASTIIRIIMVTCSFLVEWSQYLQRALSLNSIHEHKRLVIASKVERYHNSQS